MENIAKAIIRVMTAVKGIDKTMTVGTGSSSYKGVSDQVVKQVIGKAMEEAGLCILPIGVEARSQVDRWEAKDYNGNPTTKQSVFTEVNTRYMLLHTSGESIELSGYGHGVDSQDKGAGKATTYALKYTLLYTFLVPTGKIDDADTTHSDEIAAPAKQHQPVSGGQSTDLPWLNENTEQYQKAVDWLKAKPENNITRLRELYKISKAVGEALNKDAGR